MYVILFWPTKFCYPFSGPVVRSFFCRFSPVLILVRSFELLSPVKIKVISQDLYERILNFVEMLMTQLLRETDTTLTVTACGWRLHMADPVVEEEVDIAGATAEAMVVVEEDTEEDLAVEEEVEVDVLVHHPEDQTTELWCQVRSDPKFQKYEKTSVTQVVIHNK